MKNKNRFHASNLFAWVWLLSLVGGVAPRVNAQPATNTSVVLSEGVVIDKTNKQIYITTPDAKVQAISLASGQAVWKSTSKAKALNIVSGKLLVQTFDSVNSSKLIISEMDPARNGTVKFKNSIQLPSTVKTSLSQTPTSSFKINTVTGPDETYFVWNYHALPKGIDEGEGTVTEQSGAVKLIRSTNKISILSKTLVPKNLVEQPIIAPQNDSLPILKTPTFISKDGNYLLRSEKTAGNEVFNNYRWEIYETATGKLKGTLTDSRSYAPFYIDSDIMLYEIGPYTLSVNNQLKETPLTLVAFDLKNKKEVWRNEIFNPDFTGITPP